MQKKANCSLTEAEDLEVRGPDATEMSTWAIRLEASVLQLQESARSVCRSCASKSRKRFRRQDLAREASNVAENGVPAVMLAAFTIQLRMSF